MAEFSKEQEAFTAEAADAGLGDPESLAKQVRGIVFRIMCWLPSGEELVRKEIYSLEEAKELALKYAELKSLRDVLLVKAPVDPRKHRELINQVVVFKGDAEEYKKLADCLDWKYEVVSGEELSRDLKKQYSEHEKLFFGD